jgi:hypothetical protein
MNMRSPLRFLVGVSSAWGVLVLALAVVGNQSVCLRIATAIYGGIPEPLLWIVLLVWSIVLSARLLWAGSSFVDT